jgi:hypothetical protein
MHSSRVEARLGLRSSGTRPRGRTTAQTEVVLRQRFSRRVVSAGAQPNPCGNTQLLMAHATCCMLQAARRVLGASAAGGSIQIGSEVLIALIIAALLLQLRPSAAGSGGMVRMVLSVRTVYLLRHGAHSQLSNLRPPLIQARPRPEETHRVPGT